jgi:ADP-ribosylglycohydrolase
MLGAIAGDVIGSVHEATATKFKFFPLFTPESCFTDDTVLSVAVAECLLQGGDFAGAYHDYFHRYPLAGYGGNFIRWAGGRLPGPYNSFGNGSAMRVSPVAWAFSTLDEVLDWAKRSAEVTHNHPEGIKGAQATAAAVFLARKKHDKNALREYIEQTFEYDLSETLDEIRPNYCFDVSCQGSVPQALIAFLESTDFEDAIRNAISLGGDADTMACIAGAVAEAHYGGVPVEIAEQTLALLDEQLLDVVEAFRERHCS